ncbi:hypothetical protein MRX96_046215 [Rhipicephalus microplus]
MFDNEVNKGNPGGALRRQNVLKQFSPENKRSVNPTAYIPFGLGPCICLGQRLALAELASATAQVLRHYSISLGESQKRDLEMDTYSFMATPKEKVFV